MGDGSARESGELDEKLYRYADERGDQNQHHVLATDARHGISQSAPHRGREAKRREQKSIEHHLSDGELGERPLAEQESGSPKTSGRGQRGEGTTTRGRHREIGG